MWRRVGGVWRRVVAASVARCLQVLLLLLLFAGLHGPLVVLGARSGLRTPRTEDVVYTNAIPRQIPHQPALQHWLLTALLGGLMPFGSGCVELGIVLSSVAAPAPCTPAS